MEKGCILPTVSYIRLKLNTGDFLLLLVALRLLLFNVCGVLNLHTVNLDSTFNIDNPINVF